MHPAVQRNMSITSNEATGINSDNHTPTIPENSTTAAENKKLEGQTTTKVISLITSESGLKSETTDSHSNRLQNLRSELNYISATDWMYDSLERKPQQ